MRTLLTMLFLLAGIQTSGSLPLTSDEFDDILVGGAQIYAPKLIERSQAIVNLQIVMDRTGFSPGVIDGLNTHRFQKALAAFRKAKQIEIAVTDIAASKALLAETGGAALIDYTISDADLSYRFTPEIPRQYVEQASMERINFRSVQEMLAERFHMDEAFLRELNADVDLTKSGTTIKVAAIGKDLQTHVARIVADKSKLQLRAFNEQGHLIATYPASIGSHKTPSPIGTHLVRNKAQNPAYTYDPAGSAQPGLTKGLLLLPPGPNGPVGNAWIGLSKRTYGIHGTAEPSQIGVTHSFGCIRLTNWDALELARLVRRGVEVAFIE